MSFDIDAEKWLKCERCNGLFTEEFRAKVWHKRAAERDRQLARLSEEKRAEIGPKLAPIPSCPRRGCPGGLKGSVAEVMVLGDTDRRNIMRKARRQEVWGWVRKRLSAFSQRSRTVTRCATSR